MGPSAADVTDSFCVASDESFDLRSVQGCGFAASDAELQGMSSRFCDVTLSVTSPALDAVAARSLRFVAEVEVSLVTSFVDDGGFVVEIFLSRSQR